MKISKNGIEFDDFIITKREILTSISIIAVMMLIGILISAKISESRLDENEKYNKAVKIESHEMFRYAMDTNIGNAFVYGELKPVDSVTYPEIGGEYMSVKKVEEEYTRHTKTVPDYDKDGNITGYHEEVYWSWDVVDRWFEYCQKVTFLGVEFDFGQIYEPTMHYIETRDGGYHIRYVYYGSDTEYMGTIFSDLRDQTVNNVRFYNGMDISETVKQLQSSGDIIFFWILWIVLTGGCVFAFFYEDNKWLE